MAKKTLINAWSCGGGVDSTAIAALIVEGVLPKPDLAYMTDCGWESEITWNYVRTVTIPRLAKIGVDLQIIDSRKYTDTEQLVDKNGNVLIPAYSMKDGKPIKFRTHCNSGWKVSVARKWLRGLGVEYCSTWLGIAADEKQRARPSPLKWCQNRYPLIELNMTREDCLFYLGEHGWPRPMRTSCIICPQQSDEQWNRMKDADSIDWHRAICAERTIQEVRPDVYLHRSMVPLSEVDFG